MVRYFGVLRARRTVLSDSVRTGYPPNGIRRLHVPRFAAYLCSRLVMAGVDLSTVKDLMGHKDIRMTLRYTHLSSDHKQRAVRALEQFGEKSQQFS